MTEPGWQHKITFNSNNRSRFFFSRRRLRTCAVGGVGCLLCLLLPIDLNCEQTPTSKKKQFFCWLVKIVAASLWLLLVLCLVEITERTSTVIIHCRCSFWLLLLLNRQKKRTVSNQRYWPWQEAVHFLFRLLLWSFYRLHRFLYIKDAPFYEFCLPVRVLCPLYTRNGQRATHTIPCDADNVLSFPSFRRRERNKVLEKMGTSLLFYHLTLTWQWTIFTFFLKKKERKKKKFTFVYLEYKSRRRWLCINLDS